MTVEYRPVPGFVVLVRVWEEGDTIYKRAALQRQQQTEYTNGMPCTIDWIYLEREPKV